MVYQLIQSLQKHAGKLTLAGIAGVVWHNWRLWQHNKAHADQIRSQSPSVPLFAHTPKISVLVAAWNEGAQIDDHLRSFLALRYPNIELIIGAGGTDDTWERARRHQSDRVTVLYQQPGEGKQRVLARCFEHARGELIYFTDADCVLNDAALEYLVVALVNDGEHAATGCSRPLDGQRDHVLPVYLWSSDVAAAANALAYSSGLLGRNALVTRNALVRAGGLDFPAKTGTDYQLAKRLIGAGVRIRYVGASVVASSYPPTVALYRRKQRRWLRNVVLHGRRFGAHDEVRATLRTVGTGAAMLVLPLCSLIGGRLVWVVWLLVVAHAAASKTRYVLFAARVERRRPPWRVLGAVLPLTLLDCAIWASPLLDLLDPKKREQW